MCNDGFTVSFQPYPRDSEDVLHHHQSTTTISQNGSAENGVHHGNGVIESRPRPIEFRRRVVLRPEKLAMGAENENCAMMKLLREEKKRSPRMIPRVEVHPIKLVYSVLGTTDQEVTSRGFVLVSQRTLLYRALHALMKLAAPNTSVFCKRIWSKRERGTKSGDGFELLDMDTVDGRLRKKENEDEIPGKLLGEWVRSHGQLSIVKEIDLLIETRRSNAEWPRASLELENRIQVR